MITVLSLLLGVAVVLAITALTGYFVAQEFAFMSVDRSRLHARADAGDKTAGRTLKVTRRTSFMLSGAQLGITVTGLLVGYVAEPLIGRAFGDILGGTGVPTGAGVAIGTVLALAFSTLVQMVFGELFPKNLAIARPEPVARWLTRSTLVYLKAFGWLIHVFDAASNLLLRMLRIEPVHDVEHSATARDLAHIVKDSRRSGDLPPDLSILLDRILDFPHRDVEHAMIPRSRVDVVETDETIADVRMQMSTGHSRYPVLDEDDHVIGVVHLEDVLAAPDNTLPATSIMRPATVLATLTPLPAALERMTADKAQLACAIDEFGGFAGILTLEDMSEELVGEITDEHDVDEEASATVAGDAWIIPGDFHIDEVERTIDSRLPEGDYETIAGLVIAAHGGLPEAGVKLDIELPADPADLAMTDEPPTRWVHVEVLEIDNHVPSSIRLEVDPPEDHVHDDPAPDDRELKDLDVKEGESA
ncbi:CBS domain containing-hemolysin-like protein [Actinocorallia herbida]|uniref:CBS domain containing-hemolysin-like protein n=1 Tax=Actinocorallia herbida TaxID=58109 RepID=A0A3N1CZ19_9ACTN|nr:hemolysin family protein [Actinocorallia herbida]ROO86530.1 CBS domain containing-hemolysin-like protein [Actinocorallia herbida]